ncbi:MAG: serine/threonine protein kinase [Planctomycetaceae bacterium]|nr:serine/threonine protein kinase [Planctomycetaceae bacterium]
MLTQATPCNSERLQQLLNGQLSEQLEAVIELHLESCHPCRCELEGLAATEDWWRETQELLAGRVEAINSDEKLSMRSESPSLELVEAPSLMFLAPSDNPAMLGRLGEFEILEFIGRGGMGLVLKGYDHELNRFVAIKVLAPHYAEHGGARRRFAREAQAAAAVVHQHVVAIHAVDATHQPPYLVMAFIPGESLQQRLERTGSFDVIEVLRIGQQVAEGLAAAHAQGLVHRDVKPANILLERNVERVLLTDFGLARAIDDASLTQSGVIAGTPQYMSPEQARGDAIDHRADLFSLGSVLYALLAGHPPFRADSPYAVLRRVNDDTPRSLREINPQIPDWLNALIAKLLAKDPNQRWQSAREVADLLKECLSHVQQPTHCKIPNPVLSLIQRPVDQRQFLLLAVVCIATLLVAGWWCGPGFRRNSTSAAASHAENRTTQGEEIQKHLPRETPEEEWNDAILDDAAEVDKQLKCLESETEF